jgi:hypothetical protein
MRTYNLKSILKAALRVACLLPFAAVAALGQQQVNLTAGPATATLPDGTMVPMWGYTCGTTTAGSLSPVITIINGGTGYATGDALVFTSASGTGAMAMVSAVSTDGTAAITGITVSNTGSGYTSAPSITVTSTSGTGAALAASVTGMCAALNGGSGWSPVVITLPTGQDLTINLTNNLSFAAGTGTNTVPTSLVIVGQLGGGLGNTATLKDSPTHATQGATWPIAGDSNGATFNPPSQGQRVQSFSTEVLFGATTSLTWKAPRPGTYLIESGTHPSIQGPMGLYGMLVVTCAPTDTTSGCTTGTAYPGVSYNAEVPLLLSEIDPAQNNAVTAAVTAVGFNETAARVLRDSVSSVSLALDPVTAAVISGGTGYHVNDQITFSGGGPSVAATAHVSSVDAGGAITGIMVDNSGQGYSSVPLATVTRSVAAAPTDTNAQIVAALSLAGVMCSDGAAACYPPAVNYTPLYYLFNGIAFNKTSASASVFPAVPGTSTAAVTGNVLVRFVNAGLRMHVPSIVGSLTGPATTPASGFSLIAEDGNLLPGIQRVQSEVFMAAGKTYDVMINVPASGGTALPVYDRELSLSGNATARDAGMLAYIGINGSTLPTSGVFASGASAATAYPDSYQVVPGNTLTVSDPAKGVIANDVNVYGVKFFPPATCVNGTPCALPHGTLTLNGNGTFTYAPNSDWGTSATPVPGMVDSFVYQANGSGPTATVTLMACAGVSGCLEANSGIIMNNVTYTSNVATSLSIKSPGILSVDHDTALHPLTVGLSTVTAVAGLTVSVDKSGGFNASVATPGTYTFTYKAQNSQGIVSATTATVTLIFPQSSGLAVKVLDGLDKATVIGDYRWIIEEDRTFYVDPTKTTNTGGTAIVPTFGTNFHTSYMPVVATGCVGPAGIAVACEYGQTVFDPTTGQHKNAVCDVGNGVCRTDAQLQAIVAPSQVHLDPTKRYYISVLPGDAANAFNNANGTACATATDPTCGHGMGGAPIAAGQLSVNVLVQRNPFPPAKLSVFVFEDDFPLNGEHDAGGAVDVLASNEPGLGSFQITLYDDAGGSGDATGTPTYDMFNMPLNTCQAALSRSRGDYGVCAARLARHSRAGGKDRQEQ